MKKIADILKNIFLSWWFKYAIVGIIFVLAMVFSKRHNILQYFENQNTIEDLEIEKAYYEQQIEKNNARLQELKSDKHDLEKFARERYFLKKTNEDVFVVSQE